mmetsp:Transcript_32454/g.46135  ORF Transcript_32454/g.46135 Transcript_32454/m.46135 type:complete len:100 (-) Transcript_32454:1516-1815(-)
MSCLKETEGNTAHPSAKEQLDNVWEALKEQKGTQRMSLEGRKWPGYDELLHEITNADYNEILTCPMDMRAPQTDEKSICPFGVVCRAKVSRMSPFREIS